MANDSPLVSAFIGNNPYQQEYEQLQHSITIKSVPLGALLLIAGFIRDTNFIARINEKCGKNANLGKVTVGECLAVMLLMQMAGRHKAWNKRAVKAEDLLLISLLDLNPSILSIDFSCQVMGRALELFSPEAPMFFNEFATSVYSQYGLAEVIEAHVYTSSMYFYKTDGDGLKEAMTPETPEEGEQLQKELPFDQCNAAVAGSRAASNAMNIV